MQYRTLADLASCIRTRSAALMPQDINLVVGVPNSGLIAANLIALRLNLPVTDVEGYLSARIKHDPRFPGKHVLVVDDSVTTGLRCETIRETMLNTVKTRGDRITTLAVYGAAGTKCYCDVTLEDVPLPRLFEWNFMHHAILAETCMDIDGVLCRHPTESENDNGRRCREFLKTTQPLLQPSVEIGWLVSCRPEKYRSLTETWLRVHGVRYRNLILMNAPDKQAKLAPVSPAGFKADTFRRVGAKLFIEGDPAQAEFFSKHTGLPVLCTGSNTLVMSG